MKGAALSTYHFHDDIQSFTLWGHGERWIVDGGLYRYDYDDPMRIHLTGRRAHNVVLINNSDVSQSKAVIPSTLTEGSGGNKIAHCTSEYVTQDGVSCQRSIVYIKPSRIIITDHLTSPNNTPIDCRQIFHIDRQKDIETTSSGFVVRSQHTDNTLLFRGDGAETWRVRGQEEPWLQGWASYTHGTVDPIEVIGFEKRGVEVEFVTVLEFQ